MFAVTFIAAQTLSPLSTSRNSQFLVPLSKRCCSPSSYGHEPLTIRPRRATRYPTCSFGSLGKNIASIAAAATLTAFPVSPVRADALQFSNNLHSKAELQVAPVRRDAARSKRGSSSVTGASFQTKSQSNRRAQSKYYLVSTATAVPKAKTNAILTSLKKVLPRKDDSKLHFVLKCALLLGATTSVIVAATIAVFWVIQDSLVYKPTKVWRGSPKASGMPHYEDVNYCTVDGVEISGWFIKQPPSVYQHARTLLYFHGTDKNASFRLKKVMGFYEQCGCNILLLSYRGYGLSTGKPNEHGVRIDAESAYDYLRSRGDVNVGPGGNLWVYGESLGGAVAIYFTNVYQHCVNALILENTFTSLLDMIKLEFPILGVFRYLSRNRWQSKKRIGDLAVPLLFLSGLKDSYIPPQMMKQMHSLATKSPFKEFVEFEKGTHNRTWTLDGFYESVARFMDKVETKDKAVVASAASASLSGRKG